MNWDLFATIVTIIGSAIGIIAFIYQIVRNFKTDVKEDFRQMERRLDLQDERIFLLATGKTLQEAMIESKKKIDGKYEKEV